jgi:type II secretory pathway component PulC
MWFIGYTLFGLQIPFYLANRNYVMAFSYFIVTIVYNRIGWKFYRLETDIAINKYIGRLKHGNDRRFI